MQSGVLSLLISLCPRLRQLPGFVCGLRAVEPYLGLWEVQAAVDVAVGGFVAREKTRGVAMAFLVGQP